MSIKILFSIILSNFRLSFCISLILYILFIERALCKYAVTTTQLIVNFDSEFSYSLDINRFIMLLTAVYSQKQVGDKTRKYLNH